MKNLVLLFTLVLVSCAEESSAFLGERGTAASAVISLESGSFRIDNAACSNIDDCPYTFYIDIYGDGEATYWKQNDAAVDGVVSISGDIFTFQGEDDDGQFSDEYQIVDSSTLSREIESDTGVETLVYRLRTINR